MTLLPIDDIPPRHMSHSLTAITDEVFEPKCNVLGCLDGSFEQIFEHHKSSLTTGCHSNVKNNAAEEFTYRVILRIAQSVLWEFELTNCFVVKMMRMHSR